MNKNKIIITFIFLALLINCSASFAQENTKIQIPNQNISPSDLKDMLPLNISLNYSPNPVVATSPVKVTAQAISSTGSNGITFRWFLDGLEKKGTDSVFEFNMNEDLIRQDLRCGNFREVKAEATNSNTKEKATASIKIPVGLELSFNKKTIGIANQNNPETVNFNLNNTNIPIENISLQVPDIFLKTQTSQDQFRYSDIVEVEASDLKNTYNNSACATTANYTNFDNYLNSLNYQWSYNGVSQQAKSGKGDKYRKAYFIINNLPAQKIQNDLAGCSPTQSQNINTVSLTISDSAGKILATKEESLDVIAPQINVKPTCNAFSKDIQCITFNSTNLKSSYGISQSYQLNPGQEVVLLADLNNFQPSQKLDITWKINSQIVDTKTINEPNTPFITSPTFKMSNQIQTVEVAIVNLVYNSNQIEQAAQSIIMTPSQERAEIATSETLGSLYKFMPKNFRSLSNFIGVAGLLGIIILLITIKEKKKR